MSWGVYEITSSEGGVRLINGIAHYAERMNRPILQAILVDDYFNISPKMKVVFLSLSQTYAFLVFLVSRGYPDGVWPRETNPFPVCSCLKNNKF